jgi:hypothetical protein
MTCAWLLVSVTILLAEQKKTPTQEQTTTIKSGANEAKSERQNHFVLSANRKEFHLAEPITLGTSDTTTGKVHVQSQIGTIEGKPAFATILVDPAEAPKTAAEADRIVNENRSRGFLVDVQACAGEKYCTETKLIKGVPVCVRWKCVPP